MRKLILSTTVLLAMTACNRTPDYDATGVFETTTVTVSAETSGKIVELGISEGDSVMLGQPIALVDTAMLALQLSQLESQQQATESNAPDIRIQISSLRSEIAHQEHECARLARLLEAGAATQKMADDAGARLNVLKGQLEALQSSLSKNSSSITDNARAINYQTRQIRQQIDRSCILSPLTGTVLEKYAEPGEFTMPGRPICKIGDLDNMYLRAYFTASQLADLHLGQEVTVIADFGGDKQYEYPGTVSWISQESEFTPKSIQTRDSRANLVYAVKIAVRNDGRLKLGQYGEVRL